MTEAIRSESGASLFSAIWSARRDPAARILNVDLLTGLIAILLPWTTTGASIAVALWAIAFVFTVDLRDFAASLKRPASALPLAFVGLVLLGLLWSEGSLQDGVRQLSQVGKLLVLPLLIYHFARSSRGAMVFTAFLISCTLLSVVSCLVALDPLLSAKLYFSRGTFIRPAASSCGITLTRARSFRCAP
jgi:hypothetical protein